MFHFSLAAFKIYFFVISFHNLTDDIFGVDIFGFILLAVNSASWIHRFVPFTKLMKFSTSISSSVVLGPFSLFFLSFYNSDVWMLGCCYCPTDLSLSHLLSLFLFILSLSFRWGKFYCSVFKFIDSILCHSHSYWAHSGRVFFFLFLLLQFSIL